MAALTFKHKLQAHTTNFRFPFAEKFYKVTFLFTKIPRFILVYITLNLNIIHWSIIKQLIILSPWRKENIQQTLITYNIHFLISFLANLWTSWDSAIFKANFWDYCFLNLLWMILIYVLITLSFYYTSESKKINNQNR